MILHIVKIYIFYMEIMVNLMVNILMVSISVLEIACKNQLLGSKWVKQVEFKVYIGLFIMLVETYAGELQ